MDTILSFEKVLVQIEKGISVLSGTGGALGQSELAGLAAAVAVGLLLCLLGLKLIRFWGAVAGLILGAAGGIYGGGYFGLTGSIPLMVGAAAGIILAVLGARFYRFGAFLTTGILAAAMSMAFLRPTAQMTVLICVGIAVVIGAAAAFLPQLMVILLTGAAGGILAGSAAYILLPLQFPVLHIIIPAAVAVLGIIIQLLLESRKRKKLHLKKADEIRKQNSTANEVDKARAMMEKLDEVDIDAVEDEPDDEEQGDSVDLEEDDDIQILDLDNEK
ncbi:hypothetical protein [Luxibacter massiliensis]|uniref:hypothetical protein n=1 Tax=Luxibacter massiliensis TaxID=2219695 RepID=UPI000F0497E6|nr:hypothetical protein [Luxibacter massiliensis]